MSKRKKTRKPRPGPRCCGCLKPARKLPGFDVALCDGCLDQAMKGAHCGHCDSDMIVVTAERGAVRIETMHNPGCATFDEHEPFTGVGMEEMLDLVTAALRENPDILHDPRVTAMLDQTHAARDEGFATFKASHPAGDVKYDSIDDWIRLPLLDTVAKWVADRANTCIHHPTPLHPEPVWACAWKPGLIVCTQCQWMLSVGVTGTSADATCDCCGRVVAGADNDDPIWPSTVWFNQLGYSFGACRDCASPAIRGVSA